MGVSLVRALLEADRAYLSPSGMILQIDPLDYFQATMVLGIYDPETANAIARLAVPGSTVLDVGAHLGYMSLLAGLAVGPGGTVHAFECDPRLSDRLELHLELNRMSWVRPFHVAVCEETRGSVDLLLPQQLGWATLRSDTHLTGTRKTSVTSVSIDDHVAAHEMDPARISLIKIDVEGSELGVLKGAINTLAASPAAVVVEYILDRIRRQGEPPNDIMDLMRATGRRPHLMTKGKIRAYQGEEVDNVIFLPG